MDSIEHRAGILVRDFHYLRHHHRAERVAKIFPPRLYDVAVQLCLDNRVASHFIRRLHRASRRRANDDGIGATAGIATHDDAHHRAVGWCRIGIGTRWNMLGSIESGEEFI